MQKALAPGAAFITFLIKPAEKDTSNPSDREVWPAVGGSFGLQGLLHRDFHGTGLWGHSSECTVITGFRSLQK